VRAANCEAGEGYVRLAWGALGAGTHPDVELKYHCPRKEWDDLKVELQMWCIEIALWFPPFPPFLQHNISKSGL